MSNISLRYLCRHESPDLAYFLRAWRRDGLAGICRLAMNDHGPSLGHHWEISWHDEMCTELLRDWEVRCLQCIIYPEA